MATNSYLFRRPSDRGLFMTAAVGFPLLILIAYFKSYYFRPFFTAKPLASSLVHAHGVVMTLWVVYFSAQIALVRRRSVRLHMTLGTLGAVLAALVTVLGVAVAADAHVVRMRGPQGVHPYGFFAIPAVEMLMFVLFFGGALFFRRRPAEHKSLMLMTAINFLPPALGRIPLLPPGMKIVQGFGIPALLALACFGWHTWKHRSPNLVFAAAVLAQIGSYALAIFLARNETWIAFVGWLTSLV